jgi:dihydrofolate reductase
MPVRLVLIAALDDINGVGKNGGIPWTLPEDLKRMRALTLGGCVCYGRRTWQSLPIVTDGQYLSQRYNILLTTKFEKLPIGFDSNGSICRTVADALAVAEAQRFGPLFVLGGYQAWEEALWLARGGVPTHLHLTRVAGEFECDTFFPKLLSGWTIIQDGPVIRQPILSKYQIWTNF